jgi:hypothetical protein
MTLSVINEALRIFAIVVGIITIIACLYYGFRKL